MRGYIILCCSVCASHHATLAMSQRTKGYGTKTRGLLVGQCNWKLWRAFCGRSLLCSSPLPTAAWVADCTSVHTSSHQGKRSHNRSFSGRVTGVSTILPMKPQIFLSVSRNGRDGRSITQGVGCNLPHEVWVKREEPPSLRATTCGHLLRQQLQTIVITIKESCHETILQQL